MADPITLNALFGLPNESFARQALSLGMEEGDLSSLKAKALGAVKGLQWSSIEADIFKGISELLNTDVMSVIIATWKQYNALAEHADESKTTGKTELVELVDHTMEVRLHPYLEIQFAEFSKKIFFDVSAEFTLKGLKLRIEDARIKSVQTGSLEGAGEIKIKAKSLLKHSFEPIDLPGRVNLGDGIPIV
jgi:hypothetical protein